MSDKSQKVPTEVNAVLQQITDPALRVALRMLFIQNSAQHKENQIALGKAVADTKLNIKASSDEMMKAFPNNDIQGHHDAHKNWMEWAARINRVINMIFEAVLKISGISLFFWMVYKLFNIKLGGGG